MKNIKLTKDSKKAKNTILIISSILILLLGCAFFMDKYIKFIDGCELFYIVMLLYSGIELCTFILTHKLTGKYHLYIFIASLIASFSGFKYINEPNNLVIGYTLIGWLVIMIVIKLIRIEDLRNQLNYGCFINLFTLSMFILLGFLVVTNIITGITNEAMILGFFFIANGIFNLVDNIGCAKFDID